MPNGERKKVYSDQKDGSLEDRVDTGARDPSRVAAFATTALIFTGCNGIQSTLEPAGREAGEIARLFWWMFAGGAVVWVSVILLGTYAVWARPRNGAARRNRLLIFCGGAVIPTIVLAILLVYGLRILPGHVATAPEGSLRIAVAGERWWWRVRYLPPDGEPVDVANEIRLAVNEPVEFLLESSNVIHSFWIPALAGKRDLIPGRVTKLTLTPTRTGIFRGACAEYCGSSHALMAFYVRVVEKDEFAAWLAEQRRPAQPPSTGPAERGQKEFLANGCGACHTVRGSSAAGVIGPDLTHAGSRISIGAGILTNHAAVFQRWITRPDSIKPGVQMPGFGMLAEAERVAIAAYLESLK